MTTPFKLSILASALALLATNASASGFQINEHSASGLGRAFAGEGAIADNASVLGRNPAAMMMFDRTTVSMAATMVDPDYSVDGAFVTDLPGNRFDSSTTASHGNAGPNAVVPAAYMIQPINEQWAVGFAMMTNYGLGTRFDDSFGAGSNPAAGLLAGETSLMSVNLNPNVAYRINEQWSLGAGVNYTIATGYVDRVNPNANPNGSHNTLANFDGSGNGWGWNVGGLFEINQDNRLALTYRSQIDVELEGDYTGAVGAPGYKADATVDVPMPAIAEFSGYHRLNQQFALHYSVMWTDWSAFEKLEAVSEQCNLPGGVCLSKNEQLQDAMRYAVGATWYVNPQWEARVGVAYDESAVQREHATISLPDADKWWYSAGATYHLDETKSIDFGMTYINGEASEVKEGVHNNEPGQPFYFEGNNEGNAFLASVQFNMLF
ncbi:outer membrane protein transport protein [Aeromonas aquatica]|uniref:outer membrane protein transport protein n=2 Tax=Aeromonas aquatica TaxID=558964 RepID=UPI00051BB03D|nr:outer membrane protein transport protein [Aeromonas aquatica]